MLQYLLHLWAAPPVDMELSCPLPAAGQLPDMQGFYDILTVNGAFARVAMVQVLLVLLLVVLCYTTSGFTTGGAFIKRWWLFMGSSALLTSLATWVSLRAYETRAMAESCATNPTNFLIELPAGVIEQRTLAGAVWAICAFFLLSLLLTQVLGRIPAKGNGFFHNRGCPFPRILP